MVTKDQTYNGWTNYETWAVALWIDNDYGSHQYRKELSRNAEDCHQYADPPGKVQQATLAAASEPEATIDTVAEWYLPNNAQPMTLNQIAEICNPDTIVKRLGMESWTKAENIPELALAMGLEEEF
ncbi:MAG: hypothetical protein F6J89_26845 [Symploca sp. SIO1C4]|uniref:DUF4339 domain-containing protein n=1 Tax=Symploca sp. SIO1C4 TaxID=2607765 RepID=A0A6B3NHG2_9CYAN|nr:hypothetical protein [Symploca sp. SIO1C4]